MLKLPEVAQRLGVSEKTARRYIKAGAIPSVFIGNAYRIREEDLEEYVRQAHVEPRGVDAPKADAPPSPAEASEERRSPVEEPDALVNIVRLLSALGREVAAIDAGSAELLRDLKVMDDAAGHAFDAYRSRLERGEEVAELAAATEELFAASVAVLEAFRAAEAREADPGKEAEVVNLPNLRRSARTPASRRDEGRARSAS